MAARMNLAGYQIPVFFLFLSPFSSISHGITPIFPTYFVFNCQRFKADIHYMAKNSLPVSAVSV